VTIAFVIAVSTLDLVVRAHTKSECGGDASPKLNAGERLDRAGWTDPNRSICGQDRSLSSRYFSLTICTSGNTVSTGVTFILLTPSRTSAPGPFAGAGDRG
jgi:hypothetical protein